MTPAVLIDRDGTLIEEVSYLSHPDQVRLFPGAAAALSRIQSAGFRVAVVTNQSAVARGMIDESRLAEIHREMEAQLAHEGVTLDGIFTCPHLPDASVERYRLDCNCRKPRPGLLLEAARTLDLDLSRSWMIGDRIRDLEAGRAAGCRCALVMTGYGAEELGLTGSCPPDLVAADLASAIDRILNLPL